MSMTHGSTSRTRGTPRLTFARLLAVALIFPVSLAVHAEETTGLRIKGSESMLRVAQAWTSVYQSQVEPVPFWVQGGGSGRGISALINGHAQIATLSRVMEPRESRLAQRRFQDKPRLYQVGWDGLGIVVHTANPLKELSLEEVREIFGQQGRLREWSALHQKIEGCPGGKIQVYARTAHSGSQHVFLDKVFRERERLRTESILLDSPEEVLARVAMDPCGVAFASMNARDTGVRMVCLRATPSKSCFLPDPAHVISGEYPLTRPLYLMTQPQEPPIVARFIDWTLSEAGQAILSRNGFTPLAAVEAKKH
ncbi:MAG: phosphate ABC transporter substrate-binding protein [Magnetococcales bacterium]|nr:phosphate ABC transporter substrate-binding protein [Magnetococcales bacterium]